MPAGLVYPCDWGYIPGTLAEDGDPLDGFVLWDGHAYPGILIVARPIGVLRVSQTPHTTGVTVRNDRVALMPVSDSRAGALRSIEDLSQRTRDELQQFFAATVAFEPKRVEFQGWGGSAEAWETIRNAGTLQDPPDPPMKVAAPEAPRLVRVEFFRASGKIPGFTIRETTIPAE